MLTALLALCLSLPSSTDFYVRAPQHVQVGQVFSAYLEVSENLGGLKTEVRIHNLNLLTKFPNEFFLDHGLGYRVAPTANGVSVTITPGVYLTVNPIPAHTPLLLLEFQATRTGMAQIDLYNSSATQSYQSVPVTEFPATIYITPEPSALLGVAIGFGWLLIRRY